MSTINTDAYFRLDSLGAATPIYLADLIVISDPDNLEIDMVFHMGKLVAKEGKAFFSIADMPGDEQLKHAIKHKAVQPGKIYDSD